MTSKPTQPQGLPKAGLAMTVVSECQCGKVVCVQLDTDGMDAELVHAIARIASHSICDECGQRHRNYSNQPRQATGAIRMPYTDN
jgi:hypothetical protein